MATNKNYKTFCESCFLTACMLGYPIDRLKNSDPKLVQRLYEEDPIKMGELAFRDEELHAYVDERMKARMTQLSQQIASVKAKHPFLHTPAHEEQHMGLAHAGAAGSMTFNLH